MDSSRSGILAGGNWIIDIVKMIDVFPAEDALANVLEIAEATNGGAPYNVLKDLARLGVTFPLEGVGLVGEDTNGTAILRDCEDHGIGIGQMHRTGAAATSFTDVLTVHNTGRRTFFYCRGANALLGPEHFDFSEVSARIFHLGYLLLLDRLDRPHPDFGTGAGAVLASAREAGMVTSVDVVSEDSLRFREVVLPVLPQVDVLFVNEFEAGRITGRNLGGRGGFDWVEMRGAAEDLLGAGVRGWVFLHCEEGALAVGRSGEFAVQGSVCVPASEIAGTTGAGDAFAAGVLAEFHDGRPVESALRLGVAAAAASLRHASASGGVDRRENCIAFAEAYGYRELCV